MHIIATQTKHDNTQLTAFHWDKSKRLLFNYIQRVTLTTDSLDNYYYILHKKCDYHQFIIKHFSTINTNTKERT